MLNLHTVFYSQTYLLPRTATYKVKFACLGYLTQTTYGETLKLSSQWSSRTDSLPRDVGAVYLHTSAIIGALAGPPQFSIETESMSNDSNMFLSDCSYVYTWLNAKIEGYRVSTDILQVNVSLVFTFYEFQRRGRIAMEP